jgi:hypothetical protein
MQVYESTRLIGFVRFACAAWLALTAAGCIGPGLEPPGREPRQTASASAGTGATAAGSPTATGNKPADSANPAGQQPPATMQPATAGASAPTMAPTTPTPDAGTQGGQSAAAGRGASVTTPPGKDDDAGVP